MKKAIILIISILALVCSANAAKPRTKASVHKVVYVTTLDCENCAKKIRENVSFEKGVKDLKVDVPTKQVAVAFDSAKTDTLALRKAINKLGYKAKVVSYE